MSAAHSRIQVSCPRQERDLTGGCCVVAVFWLGAVLGLCRRRLGRFACLGFCSAASVVLAGSRFGSVLGWGCWRGLFSSLGGLRSPAVSPRCAVLRSNGWVSAPHGRRCVSDGAGVGCVFGGSPARFWWVRWRWRSKAVKQAKAFSGGVVCFGGFWFGFGLARWFCWFWFSNRQVKFSFSLPVGVCQARVFWRFFPDLCRIPAFVGQKKAVFFVFFQKKCVFSQKNCVFAYFLLDNYRTFMIK